MIKWPKVVHEFETIKKLQEGFSISRYGDGELKLMTGSEYIREKANHALGREMRDILAKPHPNCLVGIWPLNTQSPKCKSMTRHKQRYLPLLSPKVKYYSSLITRPDSAPWIGTREYALEFQKLWAKKRVALLCEETGGARRALGIEAAANIAHIACTRHGAYAHIDEYESAILGTQADIAILSCGPTASCLANRLAGHGMQAIDFGSAGAFLARLLKDA